jgi:endonuclease YncB( thermonuclease family)
MRREITQAFGQNARTALSALAANQGLSAECRKLGAQDVCRVRIGGKDVALELVRAGMAWWNPQHASLQTDQERADYQQAEFNAKIRQLWARTPSRPGSGGASIPAPAISCRARRN